eukprot:g12549.t1
MSSNPDPSRILQNAFGFWNSKVLLTAVEFGLFTRLAGRRLTGAELGEELELHPRAIADFFDALVAMKFLGRDGDGPQARYFNLPEGLLFLDEASPRYIGGILIMLNARLFRFWNDLPEALRTGRPQNEIKHGQKGMFEELYSDLPRLEQFMGAMTGLSRINFEAFASKFDFSDYETLCDVGGATGLLSIEVARQHPHLKCVSFDLPPVEAIAQKHIAEAGLENRIDTAAGDFFKDPLPKADVITMGMILHDWNLEKKMHLIESAYDALPPGGALVAIEALIDDARRENVQGLLMSLNMLIEFGDAFDYSGADFRACDAAPALTFGGYDTEGFYDELIDAEGRPRPEARLLVEKLNSLEPGELRRRQKAVERSLLQLGITFTVYGHEEGTEKIWPFDIVPRIIGAIEWDRIERGLKQRIKALNLFIDDIYSDQNILNDGVIPRQFITDAKTFREPCRGLKPPRGIWCHITGTDLVRNGDGEIFVLEDNLRCPSGVSYVLQNRTLMKRNFPQVFEESHVRPVIDYPARLYATLRHLAPEGVSHPTVVVLTPGIYNSAYYEHSFLALQMGVELVEGRDLVVKDGYLYMRTTQGPQKVDVVYRRVDDDFIDPKEFRPESMLGVPGLMDVYRQGRVALANAPGTGIADDKVIYAYVPQMIEYYLNEKMILPNVPTYVCLEKEQRDYVLDHLDELVVKAANESGGYGMMIGPHATDEERQKFAGLIRENPRNYIAQPTLSLSRVPTLVNNHFEGRHVDLRPYILYGEEIYVLPGGLTRAEIQINSGAAAGMLSRVADAIFWMARYVERAENLARFVDVTLNMFLDQPDGAAEAWLPLVYATGEEEWFAEKYMIGTQESVIRFLTFDEEYPNSIVSSLYRARENARCVREAISPEMWEQINECYHFVRDAAHDNIAFDSHSDFFSAIKRSSHLFNGITDGTMTRGEGWHFANMGRLLERADKTSRILDVKYFILLPNVSDVGSTLDDLQWSAVLHSVSGLETYRKRYHEIHPKHIVQFLILDQAFPRAVQYCLMKADDSLHAISGTRTGTFHNEAEQLLGRLRSEIAYIEVDTIIEQGLHEFVDHLQKQINAVGGGIHRSFIAAAPTEEDEEAGSQTHYRYDRTVAVGPQTVRLRPAPHCRTPIDAYSLKIDPADHFLNWQQDPQGNFLARVVFPKPADHFRIEVNLIAEMTVINPFDFFLEPAAEEFPFDYDDSLSNEIRPFLRTEPVGEHLREYLAAIDVGKQRTNDFLVAVNQQLRQDIGYLIRMEPGIQSCEDTLRKRSGSCRDSAWLLVQILRNLGLAARFVSGYLVQLAPDIESLDGPSGPEEDFTDLHAWTEVYLPGAGWIGLDPTSGLFCGEGHIPLAATPDPSSAAPVTGAVGKCETEFDFSMSVTRYHEDPRVTKPYTEDQWAAIDALGKQIDHRLDAGDVRLTMGGEPTFVSIDDMEGPEWNSDAVGPTKRRLSEELLRRLQKRFAPGALLHFGQGKWYPGESLPRWSLTCLWRPDGEPVWNDTSLIADEDDAGNANIDDARNFSKCLADKLGIAPKWIVEAHEDVLHHIWKEQRLPVNVDPLDSKLKDAEERARLARVFENGVNEPRGCLLPLKRQWWQGRGRWTSGPWPVRSDRLFLLPGDSPMGLRLPLDALPWTDSKDPQVYERDPLDARPPLPSRQEFLRGAEEARDADDVVHQHTPERDEESDPETDSAGQIVRTALCVEPRDGFLHVFLPPVSTLEDYLELTATVEATAADLETPVIVEGYPPPSDRRIEQIKVTPDPGVIEVNVQPAGSWEELVHNTTVIYEEARLTRLGTEKFDLDGSHTGTGGGNHVVLGGATPADSPFLRRPDLLKSLVGFWNNHPSLSYLFSGKFVGPTSQAPRVDEGRRDALYELQLAFDQVPSRDEHFPPWRVDRLFRNLLIDLTGNTHRAEFCIDKLYSPDSATGRLGLVELRAFEMPPHAQMSLAQQLLIRALVAQFWDKPYDRPLIHWGTALHDRYLLPYFVKHDLGEVVDELRRGDLELTAEWFDPHYEFRFPRIGDVHVDGIDLELRQAIEPWYVLGEEPAGGGTVRFVDSSVERLQVCVSGIVSERHAIVCNGRRLRVPDNRYLHHYAADLARAPSGRWWVLGDRTSSPAGSGYALENRIVTSRMMPEIFRKSRVERLAPHFLALRDSLQQSAPQSRDNPHIVLLTRGSASAEYFEDAYLSRYLGYTLVESGDLAVRNNRVMLKTLGGLVPIDVIFRRPLDDECDPVELKGDSLFGVAGLLEVIRAGNVAVANALGSGLAESPMLIPFLPALCRQLLGEDLRIPAVATWWCGDPKACKHVLGTIDSLVIRSAFQRSRDDVIHPARLDPAAKKKLIESIQRNPAGFVGQETVRRSTAPVWEADRISPWHVALRSFLVAGTDGGYTALPGGLVRMSASSRLLDHSMSAGDRSQDAWILADKPVGQLSLLNPPGETVHPRRGGAELPSRVAENLFWFGRYVERVEGSVRLLRAIFSRLTSETDYSEIDEMPMLLRCLASLGQIEPGFVLEGISDQLPVIDKALPDSIFNEDEDRSLASSVLHMRRMASLVRDRISLDLWRIVTRIEQSIEYGNRTRTSGDVYAMLNQLVLSLSAFGGLVSDSMTRALGWRFLEIGRLMERVLHVAVLIRSAIVDQETATVPILEAALEVGDSLMTYRSRYLASLHPAPVIDLLLLDETSPRSIGYQLCALNDHVGQLPRDPADPKRAPPMKYKVTHTTTYNYGATVAVCHNQVHLTPREGRRVQCPMHRLSIRPTPTHSVNRRDYFGNRVHWFSIEEGHRRMTVTATSRVKVLPAEFNIDADSPAWETVRDSLRDGSANDWLEAVQFLYDSPTIPCAEELAEYARPSFPEGRPILQGVRDLTSRIYTEFEYDPRATEVTTPTLEAFGLRRGVCQDFAHIQIGCLRSIGLAARYVSGYLRTEPPPDSPRLVGADRSHAWLSIYCGPLGWLEFDPTNDAMCSLDHVMLAWGREYSDVSPIKGVFLGGGTQNHTVSVDVLPLGEKERQIVSLNRIDDLLNGPAFETAEPKAEFVTAAQSCLETLQRRFPRYGEFISARCPEADRDGLQSLDDVNALPALFLPVLKSFEFPLPEDIDVTVTLTSSGTSGRPSAVPLDDENMHRRVAAMAAAYRELGIVTGPTTAICFLMDPETTQMAGSRVIDSVLRSLPDVQGIHYLARMSPSGPEFDREQATGLVARAIQSGPVLAVGYPALIATAVEELKAAGTDRLPLPEGSLIMTGGGWKSFLPGVRLDQQEFRQLASEFFQLPESSIRDMFGLSESPAVFVQCEQGGYHVPAFAWAQAIDPETQSSVAEGVTGLLQLTVPLTTSYPLLKILTTDKVIIQPNCPCGRKAPTIAIEAALQNLALSLSGDALGAELDRELGRHDLLERWQPDEDHVGHIRGFPLGVVAQVLAGNVFLNGIVGLAQCLLTRNAALLKISSRDTGLTALFVESLREADTEGIVSPAVAVCSWSSERDELNQVLRDEADGIVVWGGEAAIGGYPANRCRGHVIHYGPRLGIGFVLNGVAIDETLPQLAWDVALWEQQACSSPRVLFVEQGEDDFPRQIAAGLSDALTKIAAQLTPRELTLDDKSEVLSVRELACWNESAEVFSAAGRMDHSVLLCTEPPREIPVGNRTVCVVPIAGLHEVEALLTPYRRGLQTAVLAAPADRWPEAATVLAQSGITQIAAAGSASSRFLGLPHEGEFALRRLIKLVGIDLGAGPLTTPERPAGQSAPVSAALTSGR